MRKIFLTLLILSGNAYAQRWRSGQVFPSITDSGNGISVSSFTVGNSTGAASGGAAVGAVTISSFGVVTNNRPCINGYTRKGLDTCIETSGAPVVFLTSTPTGANAILNWGTATISALTFAPYACSAMVRASAEADSTSAGYGTPETRLQVQPIGTGLNQTVNNRWLDVIATSNTTLSYLQYTKGDVPLNSLMQFEYACRVVTKVNGDTHECKFFLDGYKECY